MSTSLQQELDLLATLELIRRAQSQPELEYRFRHALVQEAAYSSLLKNNRKMLNLAIGDVLERLYPERRDELAPVLAHHFDEGEDCERAIAYFRRAGDLASGRFANAEAIMHYTRALALATATSVDGALLAHLFAALGRTFEMAGRYAEALANYRAMDAQARQCGDRAMELAALMLRATIRSTPTAVHDPVRGQALSAQALALARELGDRRAESKILWNLMLLNQFTGHMREAVTVGEQSLALARELNMREQLAYTLNDIMRAYVGVGQFERAWQALDEARAIWRELDNLPMLTDNLGRSARILFAVGAYERAIESAGEARRLSQSIGNLWGQAFCRMFVGNVYFDRGEIAQAIQTMEEGVQLSEQAGLVMAQVGTRADLAWVYGTLGDLERGLALARRACAVAETRLPGLRTWSLGSLARLQLKQGDLSTAANTIRDGYARLDLDDLSTHGAILVPLAEAEHALLTDDPARAASVMEGLIARLRRVGMRPFVADALYLQGEALLAHGYTAEAHEVFQQARRAAEAIGSRRMLWLILASLSESEAQRGHDAEARTLRQQAREVVAYIAEHCPPDLREAFLRMPQVKQVNSEDK